MRNIYIFEYHYSHNCKYKVRVYLHQYPFSHSYKLTVDKEEPLDTWIRRNKWYKKGSCVSTLHPPPQPSPVAINPAPSVPLIPLIVNPSVQKLSDFSRLSLRFRNFALYPMCLISQLESRIHACNSLLRRVKFGTFMILGTIKCSVYHQCQLPHTHKSIHTFDSNGIAPLPSRAHPQGARGPVPPLGT